jgi:hypothetical protein
MCVAGMPALASRKKTMTCSCLQLSGFMLIIAWVDGRPENVDGSASGHQAIRTAGAKETNQKTHKSMTIMHWLVLIHIDKLQLFCWELM